MLFIFLCIFFAGLSGLIIGIMIGLVLKEGELKKALKVFIKAFIRTTEKKWLRFTNPDLDTYRVQRDQIFIELSKNKRIELADAKAIEATTEIKHNLLKKFGGQIEAIYLFGSRARGDYQSDSDLDIGIFLTKSCIYSDPLRKELIFQSIKISLKYGLYVQTRIFNAIRLDKPSENYLSRTIKNYGIRI